MLHRERLQKETEVRERAVKRFEEGCDIEEKRNQEQAQIYSQMLVIIDKKIEDSKKLDELARFIEDKSKALVDMIANNEVEKTRNIEYLRTGDI